TARDLQFARADLEIEPSGFGAVEFDALFVADDWASAEATRGQERDRWHPGVLHHRGILPERRRICQAPRSGRTGPGFLGLAPGPFLVPCPWSWIQWPGLAARALDVAFDCVSDRNVRHAGEVDIFVVSH